MGDFRLTERAREDLISIFIYGDEVFGRYHAEAYFSGLDRTFALLADFPKAGASAAELMSGLRRFRFQAHIVYFTDEGDFVLIRAVLSARQALRPSLFD